MGADMGPSQAGDLGSASPCYSCRSVHLLLLLFFFFLLQPNPIAEGSTQGPLQTDGGQSSAGVVWDGPPASPFAWSFLITHQPEPDSPRKNSSPAPAPQAKLCPLTYEN